MVKTKMVGGKEGGKDKLEDVQTKSNPDFQEADDLQYRLTEMDASRFPPSK